MTKAAQAGLSAGTGTTTRMGTDLVNLIAGHLPCLRRYASALVGSQTSGDFFVAATLEALLENPSALRVSRDAKVGLFHTFHLVWTGVGAPVGKADTRLAARAQAHMAMLTANSRAAVLLSVIEGFAPPEIATIMQIDVETVTQLTQTALQEMEASVAGRVLILENEALIARRLSTVVQEMGHAVTGVAATRREAVALAARDRPDLILADVQLADQSSGIDAVNDILLLFNALPVIFVTAFPERLLTGTRPESAFLIAKPFTEEQIYSAVSQALFFASIETLTQG